MLIKREQPLWTFYEKRYWLFPDVKLSKSFKFKFGLNFYKDNDKYGQELIVLKFPLDVRLVKKNNIIILVNSQNHSTKLLWSRDNNISFSSSSVKMHTIRDYNNVIGYYHLVSARKGTKVILREEGDEEMELVF